MEKESYESPELVELGSFESLTQGTSYGESLDATFPDGTPRAELTFS